MRATSSTSPPGAETRSGSRAFHTIARLEAIADDAITRAVATSALVGEQQSWPEEKTGWESVTTSNDDALKLASWHADHIRGLDNRVWLSADLARRVDRARLSEHVTITELEQGLRLTMPDDRPRADLAPLEELLADLLPSVATIEKFTAARALQLAND